MPDEIELKAMGDHDLLVMAVMQGNEHSRHLEQINKSIQNHEKRITVLESQQACSAGLANNPNMSKAKIAGYGGGIFVIGSLIGGIIYAFGQAMGWW